MTTREKSIRARVAVALYRINGKQPSIDEVDKYAKVADILFYAICGAVGERAKQKRNGQLRLY